MNNVWRTILNLYLTKASAHKDRYCSEISEAIVLLLSINNRTENSYSGNPYDGLLMERQDGCWLSLIE